MAATAQAQAEATKAAQRAGIEHAKAKDGAAYLGRKPSYALRQFEQVRTLLGQEAVGIARIAQETGLPPLRNGETAQLQDPKIENKETGPPPSYNEGTLIEAMQNA